MIEHTLSNANGLEMRVLSWGGIIRSLRVPDRSGSATDVVLGLEEPEHYLENPSYLGALVGRYANRIGGARFVLDGRSHALTRNDGDNHLHGGRHGFHNVEWEAHRVPVSSGDALELHQTSPAGEEGYPGRLETTVVYTLTDANALVIGYRATADAPTVVNLSQHSYFNLAGHDAGAVLGHVLEIDADRFLPVDAAMIPIGRLSEVAGTPFDFRAPTPIGAHFDDDDEQLRLAHGYDHCFALRTKTGAGHRSPVPEDPLLRFAARLSEPASGRFMEVWTTEPGLQLYTGNHLDVRRGKGGVRYISRAAVALETQHFPDSPNQPAFPSTILRPGEEYRSRTAYVFGVAP